MRIYKIKLDSYSATLTPFQADTIFGHLCWVFAHQEGEEGLKKFLQPFKEGRPPFVISDGFPGDLLPKPLSAEFNIDDPIERKELKKFEFIKIDDFNLARKGEKFKLQPTELIKTSLTVHNTISRYTNTTPLEGGIYSLEETYIQSITIYIKVISEEWKNKLVELFENLSKIGYGRKKSIGKGQFSVEKIEKFEGFKDLKDSNGFVTLSNFCPAEDDPIEGFYKTFVKYGKLGEEFTFCGNPFKRPLLMIKTGSIFKTNGKPKEFYGRMIEGIAPAKPEVVHYGYAFAVPVYISQSLLDGR
jgi:CRISPR-associated protein Csm4